MENQCPAFFKFYIPEISANQLKIPPAFINQCIQGALPENVFLRDRYQNMWQVKVEEVGNDSYFKAGWRNFVQDNFIKGGDMIVFQYLCRGLFQIKIFGSSAFETKGVGGPLRKNADKNGNMTNERDDYQEKECRDGAEQDNDREKKPHAGGAGTNPSGNKRDLDWYGVEIFQSGLLPQPLNPYFVTQVRRNRRCELYIPMDVIKSFNFELPEVITFVNPQGREFRGERKIWSDGRILYVKGWKSLCNVNLVTNEDKCICEFIRREEDGDLYINVTFYRANRQQL